MRLIFLQKTTDAQGGSKASLRNTLKVLSCLPDLEIEVCGAERGPLSDFVQSLGMHFRIMPFPRWRQLTERIFFKRTLKRFARGVGRADWIISNEMWWTPHAIELSKYCGAQTAAIVRDEIANLKKARQYVFHKLDRVISVSEDLRNQFVDDSRIYSKTRTIYNIVERPLRDDGDARLVEQTIATCPSVRRWIVCAGTLCARKDQNLLVETLVELSNRGDVDSGLLFVGGEDGTGYASELRQRIALHRLDGRVAFTGQLSSIGSALEKAEIFVLTSQSEGLPRVLIESLLARVPAISTRVSGVSEVFGSDIERFVLASREPAALADKIESLLNLKKALPVNEIANRLEDHFSRKAHLESWKSFLQ